MVDQPGNTNNKQFDRLKDKSLSDVLSESDFINDIVVNNAFEGILIVKDEKIIFSNNAIISILEHEEKALSGTIYDMIYEPDREIVKDAYECILAGEKITSFDFRVQMKDASIKFLMANGMRLNFSNENALLAFVQDITDRKRVESALRTSERRHRLLVEKSSDIFVEINAEGRQVFVSPVAEYITGYKIAELENKSFADVIHPDDHKRVFEMWEVAIKNPSERHRIEYRHIHKSKGYIWVEAHGQSFLHDPAINRVFTFVRDITDRKKLEIKLKEQQTRYDIIAENISDVIWIFNASRMRFTYISSSVKRLRGYTVEEAMSQSIGESLAPESVATVQKHLVEAMEVLSKNPNELIKAVDELQQPCKDGKVIWIEVSSTIQLNAKGEVEVLGISRNIDDRKNAVKALKESEEKYRKLIHNMDEGVVLFDETKTIVSYNDAAKRILKVSSSLNGMTSEHFKHRTIHEDGTPFVPEEHPSSIVLNEKHPVKNVVMGVRNSEGIAWIKINAEYVMLGQGNIGYALVNFYDITQLKEQNKALELANRTKDKFISIMAHDLKSPFNAVLGYTEMLVENARVSQNEDMIRLSEAAHNSSYQAVALLDNLLDWSRAQTGKLTYKPDCFHLKELVNDILMSQESVAEHKLIKLNSESVSCDKVYGDCNMINTILRNLISNAIKFSHRGGEVKVTCKVDENRWCVSVSDNGIGMQLRQVNALLSNEQQLSNVGTEGEQGTGLGFSIINEFVRHHSGQIKIDSVPAEGTTVSIIFPMH
jgi:PAS domain S-box-containing protein